MIFSGLQFAALLKIFGGFAALIGLLYLLKMRERLVPVSAHFLWEKVLKAGQRSLIARVLRRFFSFLLQILILVIIVLTMGDPVPKKSTVKSEKKLILFDVSASMNARDIKKGEDDFISRFEAGKEKLKEIIKSKGENEEFMIVTFSRTPVPRTPWEKNPLKLLSLVDKIRPTDTPSDLFPAMKYASEILHNDKASIIIISDGAISQSAKIKRDVDGTPCKIENALLDLSGTDIRAVHIKPEKEYSNLALTSLAARPLVADPDTGELLATVLNSGKTPAKARMDIYVDGNWRESRTLSLDAGEEKLQLLRVPLVGSTLEARIKPLDIPYEPLDSDNRAFAVLPRKPEPKILFVSRENLFIEAALLLIPGVLEKISPEEYTDSSVNTCGSSGDKCNVVIFNDFVPDRIPDVKNQIYINPSGKPFEVDSTLKDNIMITWTGGANPHPAMKNVTMKDVNLWGISTAFKRQANDIPLMQVDARGTILGILRNQNNGNRLIGIGFSLKDSDFVLQLSFPIFMLNTINWFMGTSHSFLTTYESGKTIEIHEDADTLKWPDGRITRVKPGRIVFKPSSAGIYTFSKNNNKVREIAVSLLNDDESEIVAKSMKLGCSELENFKIEKKFLKTVKKSIPWKLLIMLWIAGLGLIIMGYMRGAWGAFTAFFGVTLVSVGCGALVRYAGYPFWIALSAAALTALVLEWITYQRRMTV